jgi:RimJ/RimL family protein N-acetyltransferase
MSATDRIDAIAPAAEQSALPELSDDSVVSQSPLEPRYLFYCFVYGQEDGSASDATAGILSAQYLWTIWRPRLLPALPPGLPGVRLRLRFLFRWMLHRMHLFAGPESGILLIYDRGQLVHYSAFTPRYWRFPFVANDDFQIGDIWTDPTHRWRGLATFALRTIVAALARPRRCLWYVVRASNAPSIHVAEKVRFTLAAEGTWVRPWGLALLGAYVIRRRNCPTLTTDDHSPKQ